MTLAAAEAIPQFSYKLESGITSLLVAPLGPLLTGEDLAVFQAGNPQELLLDFFSMSLVCPPRNLATALATNVTADIR